MRRAGPAQLVDRREQAALGGQHLQDGLVVVVDALARGGVQQGRGDAQHQVAGGLGAALDVHGADEGLDRVGEEGVAVAPAGQLLAAAQQHRGTDAERAGDQGERGPADDGDPHPGQQPLVGLGVPRGTAPR